MSVMSTITAEMTAQDKLLHAIDNAHGGECVRQIVLAVFSGADPNAIDLRDISRARPLHTAAWLGKGEAIQALIEAGAVPEHRNSQGMTAASWAVVSNKPNALSALQASGVNLRAEVSLGNGKVPFANLLHFALDQSRTAFVPQLLDAGIDPNQRNSAGESAVHMAHKNPQALVWLAEYGASLDDVNPINGDRVGHKTVRAGDVPTWVHLLESGADLTTQNWQGESPMSLVLEDGPAGNAPSPLRSVTLSWLAARQARDVLREIDNEIAGARP